MWHDLVLDREFFACLLDLDAAIAQHVRAAGCRHCGGPLCVGHYERELRAFVLWRKRSFGAQSVRGDQFAERLMSVAHTARKQGRDVLAFLTDCAEAWLRKGAAPSLLAAG